MITIMQENLNKFILPFFNQCSTKTDFLEILESDSLFLAPLGKLIVYGELKLYDKATIEYERLLKGKIRNPPFRQTIKEYGMKYGLE